MTSPYSRKSDSKWALNCLHLIAFILHLIGPSCLVYVLYKTFSLFKSFLLDSHEIIAQEFQHWILATLFPIIITFSVLLDIWLFAEAAFFIFCFSLRQKMQNYKPDDDHFIKESLQEKLDILRTIASSVKDPYEFLGGWFIEKSLNKRLSLSQRFRIWLKGSYRPQLGRLKSVEHVKSENIKEWISWAFLDQTLADSEKRHPEHLQALFDEFLELFSLDFEPGRNEQITSIRLNIDPIKYLHKPLIFYTSIFVMDCFKDAFLTGICFRRPHLAKSHYVRRGDMFHQLALLVKFPLKLLYNSVYSLVSPFKPLPPHSFLAKIAPVSALPDDIHPNIRFWYYEQNSLVPEDITNHKTRGRRHHKEHREGAKMFPIVLIHGLGPGLTSYTKFLLRLRQIEPRRPILVVEMPFLGLRINSMVPSNTQIVQSIGSMLQRLGHSRAIFVGHSLGTAIVTWMLKFTDLVAGCIMFDPIVFNVYLPTLAYSFFHRKPQTAPEFLLRYMVSRELFTSFFISRHFQWRQNLCLPHYFPDTKSSTCHVFLSSNDHLIDAPNTLEYLRQSRVPVTMFEGLEHAEVLIHQRLEILIANKVHECAYAAEEICYKKSQSKSNFCTTLSAGSAKPVSKPHISSGAKKSPGNFSNISRSDSGVAALEY